MKKNTASFILILIAIAAVVFTLLFSTFINKKVEEKPCVITDTIIKYDTIHHYKPIARECVVVRYERLLVPKTIRVNRCNILQSQEVHVSDTKGDSEEITIPITQKIYTDSNYSAWVSGYKVNLDSIEIYNKTTDIHHYIRDKPKPWGVGLQIGYGVSNGRISPYVGVGINYNILKW